MLEVIAKDRAAARRRPPSKNHHACNSLLSYKQALGVPSACSEKCGWNARVPGKTSGFAIISLLLFFVVSAPKMTFAAEDVRSDIKSEIDVTNRNDGYISARSKSGTSKKLKLRTSYVKSTGATVVYDYDLNGDGTWETYSLQHGDGEYTIRVFERVIGTQYTIIQTIKVDVRYNREHAPFLVPAQNVNYTAGSNVARKAEELSKGAATDLEKLERIYKYIVETIKYDTAKANIIADGRVTGYLPKVDDTLETSKGICFDYSAMLAAMLRSQDIPAKLIKGYVAVSPKPAYHAWNEIYIKEIGWIRIRSQVNFKGKKWERMDSTFASGNTTGARTTFISEDKNYTKEQEY